MRAIEEGCESEGGLLGIVRVLLRLRFCDAALNVLVDLLVER